MSLDIEGPVADGRHTPDHPGASVNNFLAIRRLAVELSRGRTSLHCVPPMLARVIRERCYVQLMDPHTRETGGVPPHEFRRFLEAGRSEEGMETPIATVRQILGENTEARLLFEQAIVGPRGGAREGQPRTDDGSFMRRNDDNGSIAVGEGYPPKPSRASAGNSMGYAARRLGKERPDLLGRVKSGELTCHAAMIEAGFRKAAVTIPLDPEAAERVIARHFPREALTDLARRLAARAGLELA